MNFYTNFYIPTLKKEIIVNKITFGDYFEFNSYIENSDYVNANNVLNTICEKALITPQKLTNLDKFSLLLHLKIQFLDPILKLSAKDHESNSITYEIVLKNIMDNCLKYKSDNIILPNELYYKDVEDILKETGNNIDKIKKNINENKILMFDVPSFVKGIPKIYLNCFDNTLFYFCKVLYSSNLFNFYKKIKILKKDFNFLLSEIYNMNPKELDIFLNTK
jgi:hypothetical protein